MDEHDERLDVSPSHFRAAFDLFHAAPAHDRHKILDQFRTFIEGSGVVTHALKGRDITDLTIIDPLARRHRTDIEMSVPAVLVEAARRPLTFNDGFKIADPEAPQTAAALIILAMLVSQRDRVPMGHKEIIQTCRVIIDGIEALFRLLGSD